MQSLKVSLNLQNNNQNHNQNIISVNNKAAVLKSQQDFWRHAHFLHIHLSVQVMMQECSHFPD